MVDAKAAAPSSTFTSSSSSSSSSSAVPAAAALPSSKASDSAPPATNGTHNPSEARRYAYARALLGAETFQNVSSAKLLVVGAGGIGCELLKNLVLVGFGSIEIIDLDTIDLSNLNRQFLFQKQHIKKPKSIVAKQTAHGFNPHLDIVAHYANIKEPQFGVDYFSRFEIVLNALDNLDARRWVNQMCMAANVPLVESGTTGFLGQVQPIQKDVTECYDCTPKPVPKTFPVCTIRSTPSTPIHCIVWAKSWLFTQLFGADDETEDQELDKAIADGEDAKEIDNLRKEAREMRDIRSAMLQAAAVKDGNSGADRLRDAAQRVFDKVYKNDIDRLLGMEEMWKHRPVRPVPLDYGLAGQAANSPENGDAAAGSAQKQAGAQNHASLKDQRQLSLYENVELFTSSLAALAIRAAADPATPLSFDKDDDAALDFVTASSNLRSHVYSIEQKTRFQVKEMAGNIIPAIASTNAVIAGILVVQALHVLRSRWQQVREEPPSNPNAGGIGAARFVTLARGTQRMLTSFPPGPPNPSCGVCRDTYIPLRLDPSTTTLGAVLSDFVQRPRSSGGLGLTGEVETYQSTRLLSDPEFDDNLASSLASLGVEAGKMLTVVDDDGVWQPVNLVLAPLRDGEEGMVLPDRASLPELRKKVVPPPAPDSKAEGEAAEDDDDEGGVVLLDQAPEAPAPKAGTKRPFEEAEDGPDAKRRREEDAVSPAAGAGEQDGEAKQVKKRARAQEDKGTTEMDAIELD